MPPAGRKGKRQLAAGFVQGRINNFFFLSYLSAAAEVQHHDVLPARDADWRNVGAVRRKKGPMAGEAFECRLG
jgi:hypothetical protein